eukprot:COSAG01_NODE_843_length_13172_cov_84.009791_7_plen_38_part_00
MGGLLRNCSGTLRFWPVSLPLSSRDLRCLALLRLNHS